MNRLFLLCFFLGAIGFSASANPNLAKHPKKASVDTSSYKKQVFMCCVIVNLTKHVTYYCENTGSTFGGDLQTSAAYCGENDCSQSALKAYQIAIDQMMTAEAAWLSSRAEDCENAPPVE